MEYFTNLIEFEGWYPSEFRTIIKPNTIYTSANHNSVSFLCPCGCGAIETIKQGSHTQIKNTVWQFVINDGKLTIRPSMYMRECTTNSHYWITNNVIQWVK